MSSSRRPFRLCPCRVGGRTIADVHGEWLCTTGNDSIGLLVFSNIGRKIGTFQLARQYDELRIYGCTMITFARCSKPFSLANSNQYIPAGKFCRFNVSVVPSSKPSSIFSPAMFHNK